MAPPPQSSDAYEYCSCAYFDQGLCGSCTLLRTPRGQRLATKRTLLHAHLAACGLSDIPCGDMVIPSHPWTSRRKIKLAVTGTTSEPRLGIVRRDLSSQDLCDCPLQPDPIRALLHSLRRAITALEISPYNISDRSGELKFVVVMANADMSQAILRFVLRSSDSVDQIRQLTPSIQREFPWIRVVSCNLQPIPAAIFEGPEEIGITSETFIEELYGATPLFFTPQSFMQVTPEIATQLYRYVAEWASSFNFSEALDLFCGVGGFSLHLAPSVGAITGVELSPTAIASASRSSERLGFRNTSFVSSDVETYLNTMSLKPDLIVANPPRRGLSQLILEKIIHAAPQAIAYSSCNTETFARDAISLSRRYSLTKIQPFDMFPMTSHCEVVGTFLRR